MLSLATRLFRLKVGPSACAPLTAPSHSALPRCARAATLGLLLGAATGVLACNSFKGLAQCRSVTKNINETLEQARELHEQEPTPENYQGITKLLQDLETHLTGLQVVDNDLKQAVDDYVKQLHRSSRDSEAYARTLTQLAKAKADNDPTAKSNAEAELDRLRQRSTRTLDAVKPLAKRFRDACRK